MVTVQYIPAKKDGVLASSAAKNITTSRLSAIAEMTNPTVYYNLNA